MNGDRRGHLSLTTEKKGNETLQKMAAAAAAAGVETPEPLTADTQVLTGDDGAAATPAMAPEGSEDNPVDLTKGAPMPKPAGNYAQAVAAQAAGFKTWQAETYKDACWTYPVDSHDEATYVAEVVVLREQYMAQKMDEIKAELEQYRRWLLMQYAINEMAPAAPFELLHELDGCGKIVEAGANAEMQLMKGKVPKPNAATVPPALKRTHYLFWEGTFHRDGELPPSAQEPSPVDDGW